ncbi:hypothetical protein ACLOJK_008212 [Asimina triloba]
MTFFLLCFTFDPHSFPSSRSIPSSPFIGTMVDHPSMRKFITAKFRCPQHVVAVVALQWGLLPGMGKMKLAHHVLRYSPPLIVAGREDGGDQWGVMSMAVVGACPYLGILKSWSMRTLSPWSEEFPGRNRRHRGVAQDRVRLLQATGVLELLDSPWKMKNVGRRDETTVADGFPLLCILVQSRQIRHAHFITNFLDGSDCPSDAHRWWFRHIFRSKAAVIGDDADAEDELRSKQIWAP